MGYQKCVCYILFADCKGERPPLPVSCDFRIFPLYCPVMDNPISDKERLLLNHLRKRLEERCGNRLEQFVLFGSRARGDADENSDLDILIVINKLTSKEKSDLLDEAFDMALAEEIPLSPLIVSSDWFETLKKRERRLVLDIEKEGISL